MTVAFGSHAKPRLKKPRTWTRKTWAATLSTVHDELYLEPTRGAWTRTIDKDGDVTAECRDARALLVANIGDLLLVFGPDDDQIAAVEVIGVDRDGWRYRAATRHVTKLWAWRGSAFVMKGSK